MEKEEFSKKLISILEEFDSNRETDIHFFVSDIEEVVEIYFKERAKNERILAVKEFLSKQLRLIS